MSTERFALDYIFVNWWGGQVGVPMPYATAIDLFRRLSKEIGRPSICAAHWARALSKWPINLSIRLTTTGFLGLKFCSAGVMDGPSIACGVYPCGGKVGPHRSHWGVVS